MADASEKVDAQQLVTRLEQQATGVYKDDVSDVPLELPEPMLAAGFDLGHEGSRVRFRPELGFSSKPVVGPVITGVKRVYLRLLLHVFDDLAAQTDAALRRLEAALAVEIAERERLQRKVEQLESRLAGEERNV